MRIVIRIGGSIIGSPMNVGLIIQYTELLKELKNEGHELIVVVGGGIIAREFIRVSSELGLAESVQDQLAISVSRVIARLFLERLGDVACEVVSTTLEEASECLRRQRITIMGGLKPGITTDAVAALIAEKARADLLVKATDQEGVFDRDPRKYRDAVKLDNIAFEDLRNVLTDNKHKAGMHQIIDPEAIRILERIRLKVIVLNGSNPENVTRAIRGLPVGTSIG